jgi:hypothetical protein
LLTLERRRQTDALGQGADSCGAANDVRGLYDLFDHLVGARKQSWWHGEVLHLGDLKIDVQRELGRLFDRDVDRRRSSQILVD